MNVSGLWKLALLCAPLAACVTSKAVTETKISNARPTLSVEGAAPGETLSVDGVSHGEAAAFASGGKGGALYLEKGAHLAEVRSPSGETVYREEFYLGDETGKTLTVRVPAAQGETR